MAEGAEQLGLRLDELALHLEDTEHGPAVTLANLGQPDLAAFALQQDAAWLESPRHSV